MLLFVLTVSALAVIYPYLIYPATLWAWARFRGRPLVDTGASPSLPISIVIAAFNEEIHIARRIDEMLDRMSSSGLPGEIIVVSDGSTDRTVEFARSFQGRGVRTIDLPVNQGKAAALNAGCAAASGEILVFTDARQTWSQDALPCLLGPFADPSVGAVSGDLVLEDGPGALGGVGLYWRFEKKLRILEAKVHSTVGVTGAISAVRRNLYRPIPTGTVLDDVYWPLCVAMQNFRVIHNSRAIAFDRLPDRVAGEFRRKVRTLAGNYQLVARLPASLLPWRNPIWWQFTSHKLSRLLAPWGLLGLLASSGLLGGPFRWLFWAQILGYTIAIGGLLRDMQSRLVSAASSFLVLNAASGLALLVWISGRSASSWGKVGFSSADPNKPTSRPISPG